MSAPSKTRLNLLPVAAATFAVALAGGCSRDDHDALTVVVSLPESNVSGVAKATIEVDYSGAGASILQQDGGPACAFILPGIQGDFSDDGQGKLTIRAEGPRAAHGPSDIAACRMKAGDSDATADDLEKTLAVRVTGAEDAGGKPLDLNAKAGKARGTAARSETEIEAEQAKAAETAASVAPSTAPGAGATGSATGVSGTAGAAGATGASTGTVIAGQAAPSVTPAPGAVIPKPAAPPRAVAGGTGSSARSAVAPMPQASAPVVDNSQIPGNADRDPGYDDTDGDNPNAPAYDVVVGVTSPGNLGALQLKITHLGNSGGFVGRDGEVDCSPLVEAMMAQNWPGERTAQVGLINIQGFRTPAPVVNCGFRSREALSPGSFLVEVVDASDAGSADPKPLDPEPTAVILSINRR